MLRTVAVALVLLLVTAGCGAAPVPLPVEVTDVDAGFRLTISAPRTLYRSDEPIDIGATLTYIGPEAVGQVTGSGSGVVHFRLEDLDGPLDMAPVITSDCARHRFDRGVPQQVPFQKSGGWSADDPNAAFWKAFFEDPVLRLQPGRWRVIAEASFVVPDCGGEQQLLEAPLELVVA
jgi:hypothetical protein